MCRTQLYNPGPELAPRLERLRPLLEKAEDTLPVDGLIHLFSSQDFVPQNGTVFVYKTSLDPYDFLIPLTRKDIRLVISSPEPGWDLTRAMIRSDGYCADRFDDLKKNNRSVIQALGVQDGKALCDMLTSRLEPAQLTYPWNVTADLVIIRGQRPLDISSQHHSSRFQEMVRPGGLLWLTTSEQTQAVPEAEPGHSLELTVRYDRIAFFGQSSFCGRTSIRQPSIPGYTLAESVSGSSGLYYFERSSVEQVDK